MSHDFSRMTLTDTGPIVAMIDATDRNHNRCWKAMESLPDSGLVTSTACLVEILYLLGRAGGHPLQRKLWTMIASSVLQIRSETAAECIKAGELMETYSDVPMDFADGVLVVTANALRTDSVFTLDKHFYAYRKSDGAAFIVIPG